MPPGVRRVARRRVDHVGLHREVLGEAEPVERARRLLVALLDALPELALVLPGEGRRVLLRLVLEDRLDLHAQLLLRHRHEPRRLGDRPLLPRAAVQPHLGERAARARISASAASIASLHMRCVPCGSERSPATKIMSGCSSSSSARTIVTSAGPIGSLRTLPVW
jgi:hypothetical protein